MKSNICEINSDHPYLTSCGEIANIIKPLEQLGITYFCYTRHDKDGGRIYLDSHQGIQESYINKKHYLIGHTEYNPAHYKPCILHWDTLPNQALVDENARSRDIDHGMYMVEPHEDYCEFFGFATTKGNTGIINTYLSKLDVIKCFTSYFKDQADHLIKQVDARKLILPARSGMIDLTSHFDSSSLTISLKSTDQYIKLTSRQLEVVHELLKGHSIKTIAMKLKISPRTVETHIIHMKSKLSCSNRNELLIKLALLVY